MNKKLMKELKKKNVKVINSKKYFKKPNKKEIEERVNIPYAGVYKFDKAAFEKSHKLLWEQDDVEDFKELLIFLSKN